MSESSKQVKRLLEDLVVLFTSDPDELVQRFGQRCRTDSERINYALEWLAPYVNHSGRREDPV